jgi:hypothetical protein
MIKNDIPPPLVWDFIKAHYGDRVFGLKVAPGVYELEYHSLMIIVHELGKVRYDGKKTITGPDSADVYANIRYRLKEALDTAP